MLGAQPKPVSTGVQVHIFNAFSSSTACDVDEAAARIPVIIAPEAIEVLKCSRWQKRRDSEKMEQDFRAHSVTKNSSLDGKGVLTCVSVVGQGVRLTQL